MKIIFTIIISSIFLSCSNNAAIDKPAKAKPVNTDTTHNLKDTKASDDNSLNPNSAFFTEKKLYQKHKLIYASKLKNRDYQLFANLVNPDSSKYPWSANSLSIFKNGKKVNELYEEDLKLTFDMLTDFAWSEISASPILMDKNKEIIRLDIGQYPTAPGDEIIAYQM